MKNAVSFTSILALACSGCATVQPLATSPYIYSCLDFDDLTTGQTFADTDIISGGGVTLTVSEAGWTNPAHARVDDRRYARGTGLDLRLNNISVDVGFDRTPSTIVFQFGDLGGQHELNVNGTSQTLNDLHSLNGQTIAGANVAVTALQEGANWYGLIGFAGTVNQLSVGGQELWIDNVCGVRTGDYTALLDLRRHDEAGVLPEFLIEPLVSILNDNDIVTYQHTAGDLTAGMLSEVDLVIFFPKRGTMNAQEKGAVADYIGDGGGVLVIGDYAGPPTTTVAVYQDLFDVVGAVHEDENLGITLSSQNFSTHPIVQNITSFAMYAATTVSGTGYSTVVHTHNATPNNRPLVIAKEQADGRVVVTGDATFVYAGYIDSLDNSQAFLQIVEWLLKER